MRLLQPVLASTLVFGSLLTIGCSQHRYSGYDPYYGNAGPYYGNSGYYGSADDPYYRQWLAERQYNYIEYNRLDRERQREYWQWRNANAARFRNDARFRNNPDVVRNNPGVARNDHDRDDRGDRDRQMARQREGDRDRHRADRERHQVRNNKDRDRDRDHDRDHDRR